MNNRPWTPEEEIKLLTMDRAVFLEEHPHRSEDGARIRWQDLNRKLASAPPDAMPVIIPAPDDGESEDIDLSPDEYDKYFALIEQAVEVEKGLGVGVDTATYHFEDDKPVALAFTSDWHIGAGGVEYKRLRADLELIRDTPGLYGVFNGDGLENTKTHTKSASALYSAAIPKPRHQLELLRRNAGILGDKWLAWAEGNHDAFDYRAAGVDRIGGLCEELGVPYFREKGGTLKLDVGGQNYNIIVKHQYTGQSRISKSNSARRLWTEWPWDWDTGDVVALAHLHEPDTHITMQKGRDVHWLRSGTYKTSDSWAESNGFHPSYGVPLVILFPGERKILSFHGSKFLEAVEIFNGIRAAYGQARGDEQGAIAA